MSASAAQKGVLVYAIDPLIAGFFRQDNKAHPYPANHQYLNLVQTLGGFTGQTPFIAQNCDLSYTVVTKSLAEMFFALKKLSADYKVKVGFFISGDTRNSYG